MSVFALLGAVIAGMMYIPLTRDVWRGVLVQSFATYFLWGVLDTIAAFSIALKGGGNWLLPAAYVAACTTVLVAILHSRTFIWGWREWFISALVLVCVIVWFVAGNTVATIASTAAVVIASIPLFLDFWPKPAEAPIRIYVGFTVGNALSIFAGKDWSVAERFYPSVCTVLTLCFVLMAARRWLPKFSHQPA